MKCLVGLSLLIAAMLACSPAGAISLTVPITNLAPASGDRRVGDFDFGVQFSHIDSMNFEFVMPDGYQGSVVSTGNSFVSRSLYIVYHAHTDTVEFTDFGPGLELGDIAQTVVELDPGEKSELRLSPLVGPHYEHALEPFFPDFLRTGRGSVTFTDHQLFYSYPLPDGIPTGLSSNYFLPGEISMARITITGTLVPEPTTKLALCMLGCCLALVRCHIEHAPSSRLRRG